MSVRFCVYALIEESGHVSVVRTHVFVHDYFFALLEVKTKKVNVPELLIICHLL